MHIDEILARRCTPVPHEERLDIVLHKLTAHERIIVQVDLNEEVFLMKKYSDRKKIMNAIVENIVAFATRILFVRNAEWK